MLRANAFAAAALAKLQSQDYSSLLEADADPSNFPHWLTVVIAVGGILLGCVLLTHGYKLFKFGIFCVCGYFVGSIVWQILLAMLADDAKKDTLLYVISGVSGVIGGLMALYWLPVAVFMMGFAVGAMLAVALNPIILCKMIPSDPTATLFIGLAVLGLVFGGLTLYFERHILIGAATLTGSLMVMYNIGTLAGNFPTIHAIKSNTGKIPGQWWGYLGGFVGLAALGFAFHIVVHKDVDHRHHLVKYRNKQKAKKLLKS